MDFRKFWFVVGLVASYAGGAASVSLDCGTVLLGSVECEPFYKRATLDPPSCEHIFKCYYGIA